jgi:hypothetical protein
MRASTFKYSDNKSRPSEIRPLFTLLYTANKIVQKCD